jgi:hypothetical protein
LGRDNHKRNKGKIAGNHFTVIKSAVDLVDFLQDVESVNSILLGHIRPKRKISRNHTVTVKIIDQGDRIVAKVNRPDCVQELPIFTRDIKATKNAIEEFAIANNWKVIHMSIRR